MVVPSSEPFKAPSPKFKYAFGQYLKIVPNAMRARQARHPPPKVISGRPFRSVKFA
jgi:hypothetical protein